MIMLKKFCRILNPPVPPPGEMAPAKPSPAWKMHPSWVTGVEAMEAYNRWVCEVVMPIAFQWIEEHKADVYALVSTENTDDVGVVIAAAFQLVQATPNYEAGRQAYAAYQAAAADGTWDPSTVNPVWAGITEKVRAGTQRTFAAESAVLKNTIF